MSDLTSKQDLLASLRDYGTVAGKRMTVQDRACHAAADEIDRLTRREAELVKALERLAQRRDRHHDCGDYERGYGDAEASASAIARAALKEPTT